VYALARSHVVHPRPLYEGTPVALLFVVAVAVAAIWTLAVASLVPMRIARAAGAGAAQGALLATAVAWTGARLDPSRHRLPAGVVVSALAGALGAALVPLGAVAYLLAPLWLWRRRKRFRALGVAGWPDVRLLAGGAALGAGLGIHLTITASLTLGYRVGWPATLDLAPWLAYDLGANVLAAECFFRGALFDRAQRRWSFGTAAALSTAACVARYLIDPLLPRTLEVAAGAAFYVALLSVGNCWLYARSGSVVPGLAAGFVFFAVYRLLHVVR
jgi:membrane protease YdiL (CAAX protease family)